MKKFLCIVLALVITASLFVAVSAEQDTIKAVISFDKETVSVGDTVTVTVSLENIKNDDFYAADIAVFYNEDILEYVAESGVEVSEELVSLGAESIFTKVENGIARCAVAFGVDNLDKMPAKVGESVAVWSAQFKAIADGDASVQFAAEGRSP